MFVVVCGYRGKEAISCHLHMLCTTVVLSSYIESKGCETIINAVSARLARGRLVVVSQVFAKTDGPVPA